MVSALGYADVDALIDAVIPADIRTEARCNCPIPSTRATSRDLLQAMAQRNKPAAACSDWAITAPSPRR